ncbi:hypothetical protein P3T40_003401 [Paraburkholderia sp. EB58]|jgi:hypothetical protein|uniref:hypothetical protein n=1 Tax=Paraburkholderia sp. EB58 TaxID=3035125 RepID=UPI003D1CC7E5
MSDTINVFVPIRKIDEENRLVYGVVTEEVPDKDDEILDYASSKPYFQQWSDEISKATDGKSLGNIRVMHGPKAAGKMIDLQFIDADRRIETCAKIIDDEEWQKVKEGVYTGFSVGGQYKKRWDDPTQPKFTRFTAVPSEVSLVDNPCVPTAHFTVIKANGITEDRLFKTQAPAEVTPKAPAVTIDEQEIGLLGKLLRKLFGKSADDYARDGFSRPAPDVEKREFSSAERQHDASTGAALPDGSFPIESEGDLKNAIDAYGRAKDKGEAKAHIEARAKSLDLTHLLPEDWGSSTKAAHDELEKSLRLLYPLASAFEGIRDAQRDRLREGQVENDAGDDAIARDLGDVASKLASVMGQIAEHEGAEATALTDADDIVFAQLYGLTLNGASKMTPEEELQKRASGKANIEKAKGHLAKAMGCQKDCMSAMAKLAGLHVEHHKAAKADGKSEFDHGTAAKLIAKAHGHLTEMADHHELAHSALERAHSAGGNAADHGGQGGGTQANSPAPGTKVPEGEFTDLDLARLTEGFVPDYDATQPYAGKAAGSNDELIKALTDAAYLRGKVEALEKMPATTAQPSRFVSKGAFPAFGETVDDKTAALMKGVNFDPNDEDSRNNAAGKAIGNMIGNPAMFGKSLLDPSFNGQAGAKR